jgi:predicted nucleic acid-binding protein
VRCFISLDNLITDFLAPQLGEVENIKALIADDKWKILTSDILLEELQKRLQYQEVNLYLPDSNDGQATIDWIDSVQIDHVDIVSKITESKIFVSLLASAYIKFEYFVDKTDLYGYN